MQPPPPEPPYHPQELQEVTPPQQPPAWSPPQPPQGRQTFAQRIEGLTIPQTVAVGIGVGCSVLLVVCLACSALSLALGGSNPTQGSGIAVIATTTATDDMTATAEPTAEPTATIKAHPTATTHVQPTSTPGSHATNTPTPTNTPCADPCNPWGYNFDQTGGSLIYNPPGAFCSYFACISNFSNGNGYVVECNDSKFAKTGGVHGSCSQDGGYSRTLYAHG